MLNNYIFFSSVVNYFPIVRTSIIGIPCMFINNFEVTDDKGIRLYNIVKEDLQKTALSEYYECIRYEFCYIRDIYVGVVEAVIVKCGMLELVEV